MFALDGPFVGIGVNLQENDLPGAKQNFEAFKAEWTKLSGMVPEWKDRFPMGPVDALGQALNAGDPAKVGQAMGQVGEACDSCHLVNQIKAHQRYHWKDFDGVKVADPVSNQSMKWGDYMFALAGSFSAIGTDLQEGKIDNALKNFQAFNSRYQKLADGCKNCHDTPRAYYVDGKSQAVVDQLGQALQGKPDPQKVGQLLGAIGNDICMDCHLVHMPAQNRKDQWQTLSDVLK